MSTGRFLGGRGGSQRSIYITSESSAGPLTWYFCENTYISANRGVSNWVLLTVRVFRTTPPPLVVSPRPHLADSVCPPCHIPPGVANATVWWLERHVTQGTRRVLRATPPGRGTPTRRCPPERERT